MPGLPKTSKVKFSKEAKIGLLITGALVALIWGMNYMKGVDTFNGENTYYSVYPQVDGLVPSSDVILNGVKVGRVAKIEFDRKKSGKIIATLKVSKQIFIGKNSTARIVSADLLGGRTVNILLDPHSAAAVDGDTLFGEVQTTLTDQVMPIKDKVENLIESLDSVAVAFRAFLSPGNQENLNAGFADLSKTLSNLEQASASLNHMVSSDQSKLNRMIANMESITGNIRNNNEALGSALRNIDSITDSLARSNLASAIDNANLTLRETAKIMEKINKGQGTLGMLINNDSLYVALEKSATDLDKLLVDLKQNPKRYVHVSVFGGGKNK